MKNFDQSAAYVINENMEDVIEEDNRLTMLMKDIMKKEPNLDEESAWSFALTILESIEEYEEDEE